MRILKIKTQGIIKLPGVSERRTPADIDITKCNLNAILIELRKYGINDFVIENRRDDYKKTNINYKEPKEIRNEKNIKLNNKKSSPKQIEDNNEMKEKINNIEKLLENLIENQNNDNINLNTKSLNEKEEIEEELDEEFIPDIDLSGFKLNK